MTEFRDDYGETIITGSEVVNFYSGYYESMPVIFSQSYDMQGKFKEEKVLIHDKSYTSLDLISVTSSMDKIYVHANNTFQGKEQSSIFEFDMNYKLLGRIDIDYGPEYFAMMEIKVYNETFLIRCRRDFKGARIHDIVNVDKLGNIIWNYNLNANPELLISSYHIYDNFVYVAGKTKQKVSGTERIYIGTGIIGNDYRHEIIEFVVNDNRPYTSQQINTMVKINDSEFVVAGNFIKGNGGSENRDLYIARIILPTTDIKIDREHQLIVRYSNPNIIINNLNPETGSRVSIFDLSGRLLINKGLEYVSSGIIDCSSINPGIYFVKILNGTELKTAKIIIP